MTSGWARHDPVAVFYGAYDQVPYRRRPSLRISKLGAAIAVSLVALTVFVAADVSAYSTATATVRVTEVSWESDGVLLTTSPGFSLHASQAALLPLVCAGLCLPWAGASVSAPFQLVNFSEVESSLQYTNVTIRAPSSPYDGPLTITLELG